MLREHTRIFRNMAIAADLCIVTASFVCGLFLREKLVGTLYPAAHYLRIFVPFIVLWAALLRFLGMYQSIRTKAVSDILMTILEVVLIGVGGFGAVAYILRLEYVSRGFLFFTFVVTGLGIAVEKLSIITSMRYFRARGYNTRNLLIVGTGRRAQSFIEIVDSHAEWGFRVVGLVDEDASKVKEVVSGHKVIGSFGDVADILHTNVVDEVVFVVPRSWLGKIEPIVQACEIEGIRVSVAVDYFDLKLARAKQTDLDGFPLLTFQSAPDRTWPLFAKRLMDVVISGAGLLLFAPLFLAIAIAVKATSPGPVFFRQERTGLAGRTFTLFKFRTMVKDAEMKLLDLLAKNQMKGPVFKMENDPRLTPAGGFLRKLSFDELPQLWNVFCGDMSLVGPRPGLPSEVKRYDSWHRRRLSMRPGITCLWQVSGRNTITDFDKWAELDLEYIDRWSLWLDVKILCKTVPAVLLGIGAK